MKDTAFTRTSRVVAGTREQDEALVAALLEERRGYELRGAAERVAEVDAQLKRLGHSTPKPKRKR